MAKYKNKVNAALAARRKSYDAITNRPNLSSNGLHMHKPGSQNRKKGYGKGSSRR